MGPGVGYVCASGCSRIGADVSDVGSAYVVLGHTRIGLLKRECRQVT